MTKEMMGETEEEGVGGGEPDVSGNVTGVPKSYHMFQQKNCKLHKSKI